MMTVVLIIDIIRGKGAPIPRMMKAGIIVAAMMVAGEKILADYKGGLSINLKLFFTGGLTPGIACVARSESLRAGAGQGIPPSSVRHSLSDCRAGLLTGRCLWCAA